MVALYSSVAEFRAECAVSKWAWLEETDTGDTTWASLSPSLAPPFSRPPGHLDMSTCPPRSPSAMLVLPWSWLAKDYTMSQNKPLLYAAGVR